ncbi:MAG: hypothetical protein C5S40_06980 [ANME-2 cluster archaeon]|nr:hypothetical protein [ANME-2 cluster archaeon]
MRLSAVIYGEYNMYDTKETIHTGSILNIKGNYSATL